METRIVFRKDILRDILCVLKYFMFHKKYLKENINIFCLFSLKKVMYLLWKILSNYQNKFFIIFLYINMHLVACFSFPPSRKHAWNIRETAGIILFAILRRKMLSRTENLQLCDNFLQHCGLGVRGEKYMVYTMAGL